MDCDDIETEYSRKLNNHLEEVRAVQILKQENLTINSDTLWAIDVLIKYFEGGK